MDDQSYCMGLFDGEGCIATRYDGKGRWSLIVSATLASRTVCELMQATWGGRLSQRSKPTAGGLTMHTWYAGSSTAIPFLEYAAEHSLVKREQAILALQMARNIAQYAWIGYRKGTALSQGARKLSDEDLAERFRIVEQLRALNGARNRFPGIQDKRWIADNASL